MGNSRPSTGTASSEETTVRYIIHIHVPPWLIVVTYARYVYVPNARCLRIVLLKNNN